MPYANSVGNAVPVVDASVLVALFLPSDKHHRDARKWFLRAIEDDDVLHIPTLALAEVAGAIARQTGVAPLANEAIQALRSSEFQIHGIDPDLGDKAADLACALRLRGADSVYVAIARELGDALVSFDDEHVERARQVVEVVKPHA